MVVTDIGNDRLIGVGIALRCFRGGFEQSGDKSGVFW